MNIEFDYGQSTLGCDLPRDAVVVRPGITYHEPEPVDSVAATHRALAQPIDAPPLRELARRARRVAVAFPDRVKGGSHLLAHRRVALKAILGELDRAGVDTHEVRFICAVGLHRKNSLEEMAGYLGKDFVAAHRDRITNHDAEDPDGIVDLGRSSLGDIVAFNRTCAEADLTIVLGHVQGNPYGGFSGGHKTFTTGLTTWRSIAGHHVPASMHRPDFVPISTRSHFRSQLRAIGQHIAEQIGHPLIVVDAVIGQDSRVLGVFAGDVDAVEEASWPLAERRTNVVLRAEPADVVVFGLPEDFHYGPGMGRNPILVGQAIAATLARVAGMLRPDAVAVVAAAAGGYFNDEWFPSYRETFERYSEFCSVATMSKVVEDISNRPEYIEAYRKGDGYHPFHGFSMLSMAEIGLQRTARIFVAGAVRPGEVRAMGLSPVPSMEAALAEARRYLGETPRVLALPGFLRTIPPHLFADPA